MKFSSDIRMLSNNDTEINYNASAVHGLSSDSSMSHCKHQHNGITFALVYHMVKGIQKNSKETAQFFPPRTATILSFRRGRSRSQFQLFASLAALPLASLTIVVVIVVVVVVVVVV